MNTFSIVLLLSMSTFIVMLGIVVLFLSTGKILIFRRDKCNPFTRHCRLCGQVQDEHGRYATDPNGWWEDMEPVRDSKCFCHLFSRDDE